MKKINSGVNTLPLVQCINAKLGKYLVLWGCEEVETTAVGGSGESGKTYRYSAKEFPYKPTLEEVKEVILDSINAEIDERILSGFEWNNMMVWLSTENQFNYKAAFDLAMMSEGSNLPVTFKFGTTEDPVYHTFSTLSELQDFYTKAMTYINTCLSEGWQFKDAFDWSVYEELL